MAISDWLRPPPRCPSWPRLPDPPAAPPADEGLPLQPAKIDPAARAMSNRYERRDRKVNHSSVSGTTRVGEQPAVCRQYQPSVGGARVGRFDANWPWPRTSSGRISAEFDCIRMPDAISGDSITKGVCGIRF